MRAYAVVGLGIGILGGCAAIAGISDREGTLCARETHDLCEDWDNETVRHVWTGPTLDDPTAKGVVVPSDRSAPNALSIQFSPVGPDASSQGLIGDVFRERSADGLRVSFDLRIDAIDLPAIEATLAADAPPGGTLAFGIVQWNRGGIALGMRHDGVYLFLGNRPGNAPTPEFYQSTLLAPKNEVIGQWNHVEIACFLNPSAPAVEVRFGARQSTNPPLDPTTTQILETTEIIFGGVLIGPAGANSITVDNLIADFPRR